MTFRQLFSLFIFLPIFTLAQANPYQRDLNDANGNGIRDDVDEIITTVSVAAIEKTHLRYYAFFLARYIESEGLKRVQSFIQMVEHRICIENEQNIIDIKARTLDSESFFGAYNSANSAVANYWWLQSATGDGNCAIEIIQHEMDFWRNINAAYDEDICERILQNNNATTNPMLEVEYQACRDEFQ